MTAKPTDDPTSVSPVLQQLGAAGIDVDASTLTRSQYAHDASNYRITPIAVAFPRTTADVVSIVRTCAAAGVPITARGAGTGMAGNSVGVGVILDFRRHMHRIDAPDGSARTIRVQPGAVLDDVQAASASLNLMFGPDPSSHSRATIGGMLGNDACGNHSVAYGRTSDHVVELEVALADGTHAIATRSGLRAINESDAETVAILAAQLREIAATNCAALQGAFEHCPRQVSGYAAHRLLDEQGFDVARLLVGSEGSLALVVSATLALVEVPTDKQLLVLGYSDLVGAARDVPVLLTYHPAAIEALDTAIVQTMRARRGTASVPELPAGEAWLFVEFEDTIATADLDSVAAQILERRNAISAIAVTDAQQRADLWRVREDGAGLASNLLDGTRGRPGWEDAAVPPDRLAEYLEGLTMLQTQHGFKGVLYGHFGAGCVHIRFDFDTETDSGRAAMRAFIRDAATLVAACGGSISGEHGDGRARGELLPLMYSPDVLDTFRCIKVAFDPNRILNPAIVVDAPSLSDNMPTPTLSTRTTFALRTDHGDLGTAAGRCVGIGRCVATQVNAMCPTFDVTKDERHSTRGRARTIQDLFNNSGITAKDALETLDTCLSCKACASDCPTGVDISTYKSELLYQHYSRRIRPLTHYTLGWLPKLVAPLAPLARIINPVLKRPTLRRRLAPLLGISSLRRLPLLATTQERRQVNQLPRPVEPRALLFIDQLTQTFDPGLASAAVRVLATAGIPVVCVVEGDSGLTWITSGQLGIAQREQRHLLQVFDSYPTAIPVIVLEPSQAATLAHDLPELVSDARATALARRVRTFTQALDELAPGWSLPAGFPEAVVMQPHCHERATFTESSQTAWLRARGIDVTEAVGCCGMGGNFGYESRHYNLSVAVANRSLLPTIDAAVVGTALLADGFGCRCQINDLRPASAPQHLVQLLADLL